MSSVQGSGGGDDSKSSKSSGGGDHGRKDHSHSRRNEPAEVRGLRAAAKSEPKGVDRGRKDSSGRPHIQRSGGIRSRQEVMRERRMSVYGETRSQASRIGADDHTRSMANNAWQRGLERKRQEGTLSAFDRKQWVSDYGTIKSTAQKRADYESKFFDKRASSAWDNNNFVDYAKYKAQSFAADVESGFEDLKSSPLDTLADITRNPLVAGALSLTGVGTGALAGVQLIDTASDIGQEEVDAGSALRTAAADILDTTGVGEGLGFAKGIITAGLRNPDSLPEVATGKIGSMLGGAGATRVASNMMRSNPLMGAAVSAAGPVMGKLGATALYKSSQSTAEEASKQARPASPPPTSPLVTPKKKDARVAGSPKDPLERSISESERLKEADALALVREYQTSRLGGGQGQYVAPQGTQQAASEPYSKPLPYYNTLQPYRVT